MNPNILPIEASPRLNLAACYNTAWVSFRRWWIPICLIAAALALFKLGPNHLIQTEASEMELAFEEVKTAALHGNIEQLEPLLIELNSSAQTYAASLTKATLYTAPAVALLSVFLLYISLSAVKNRRKSIALKQVIITSLTHIALGAVKMMLIVLILPLGLFIYTKLAFVSFLMLEEGHSPAQAVKESWRMTRGNVWPLLGITAINTTLQLVMLPTVIGLIPSTGVVSTARAAAFHQLRPDQ